MANYLFYQEQKKTPLLRVDALDTFANAIVEIK